MNGAFSIAVALNQINSPPQSYLAAHLVAESGDKYQLNATLSHTIFQVKESIWQMSRDHRLNPLFVRITYKNNPCQDSQTLEEIVLANDEFSDEDNEEQKWLCLEQNLGITVDYTLFNSPSIPIRDPIPEFFDLVFKYNKKGYYGADQTITMRYRETLFSTLGPLKDRIAESVNEDKQDLEIFYENELITDDDLHLYQIFKIDVTPIITQVLQVKDKKRVNRRFHIKIDSNRQELQQGNNMFELNKDTTLNDFKRQIIARLDEGSVARTFLEQVKLYYDDTLITTENEDDATVRVIDRLSIPESLVESSNFIITLKLEINNAFFTAGIFSREFLRDFRSSNRFEFLPRTDRGGNNTEDINRAAVASASITNQPSVQIEANFTNTGQTYHLLNNEAGQTRFIDESYTSSQLYSIKYTANDGTVKEVKLNTSQCIVVKANPQTGQQGYVMISPSGMAKLNNELNFGYRIDGARIVNNEEPTVNPVPTPTIPIGQPIIPDAPPPPPPQQQQQQPAVPVVTLQQRIISLFRNNGFRMLSRLVQYTIMLMVFGFDIQFFSFRLDFLIGITLINLLILTFITGDVIGNWIDEFIRDVPPSLFVNFLSKVSEGSHFLRGVGKTVNDWLIGFFIKLAVDYRLFEYELLLEVLNNKINYLNVIKWYLNQHLSNFCLYIASNFPPIHDKVMQAFEMRKNQEIKHLKVDVNNLYLLINQLVLHDLKKRRAVTNSDYVIDDSMIEGMIEQKVGVTYETFTSREFASEYNDDDYQFLLNLGIELSLYKNSLLTWVYIDKDDDDVYGDIFDL